MIDPDVLAITRKRRQQGRCVACGTPSGRCAFCAACEPRFNWCPCCETFRERTRKETSSYCPTCDTARRPGHTTRPHYLAAERAKRHPKLFTILRLYRNQLPYTQIAATLQMKPNT